MPFNVRPNQKLFIGRNVDLCRPLQPRALARNCRARVGRFSYSAPQKPALVLDDSVPDDIPHHGGLEHPPLKRMTGRFGHLLSQSQHDDVFPLSANSA